VAVIDAQSVSKRFLLRHNASVELKVRFLGLLHPERRQSIEEFWALKRVSLRIDHGEALGLVGRNGSGKSTFLKLIAAIHRPTDGRLLIARGARISSMIELGVGFHPELTGRENVVLNAAIHGLTKAEIDRIYDAVVD
jgi:ABC-type polysaccharide/polyol phosphate transport system ATPase subunit